MVIRHVSTLLLHSASRDSGYQPHVRRRQRALPFLWSPSLAQVFRAIHKLTHWPALPLQVFKTALVLLPHHLHQEIQLSPPILASMMETAMTEARLRVPMQLMQALQMIRTAMMACRTRRQMQIQLWQEILIVAMKLR